MGKILIIGVNPPQQELLELLLAEHQLTFCINSEAIDLLRRAQEAAFDLVLYNLDSAFAVFESFMKSWAELPSKPPVIAVLTEADHQTVLKVVRAGASECLFWPVIVEPWLTTIQKMLAQAQAPVPCPLRFENMVGSSRNMQEVFQTMLNVASLTKPILLSGEPGTGKQTAAERLHSLSKRPGKFVVAHCSGLSTDEQESLLFGHESRAFPWAARSWPGSFEQAHRGTLYLDEVDQLELRVQQELLRAVEGRSVRRLGASLMREVDIRLIASATRSLQHRVQQGLFRTDLFWLLSGITIEFAPLRHRIEDVPELVGYFLSNVSPPGRTVEITHKALDLLMTCSFPGNIQELKNIVERAAALCQYKQIEVAHLPAHVRRLSP